MQLSFVIYIWYIFTSAYQTHYPQHILVEYSLEAKRMTGNAIGAYILQHFILRSWISYLISIVLIACILQFGFDDSYWVVY